MRQEVNDGCDSAEDDKDLRQGTRPEITTVKGQESVTFLLWNTERLPTTNAILIGTSAAIGTSWSKGHFGSSSVALVKASDECNELRGISYLRVKTPIGLQDGNQSQSKWASGGTTRQAPASTLNRPWIRCTTAQFIAGHRCGIVV